VAWLTQQGFDVLNMEGGMRAWEARGKQVVADGQDGQDGRII
jgi:rhodanese-related sulfurtransferase